MALLSQGCTDKLFVDDREVSQYDRYRILRGEEPQRFRRDPFGRQEPALRERLLTQER
ncbi:MAG: hypothetical protein JJU36_03000 [Phycisphaeraceae bacterium]|nr:hypothetical protein [Phycisphaeraceae bacterium]